jgi:hypothetical protein
VFEDCTTEEQLSILRLFWAKGLSAKDIVKCFLFTVVGVCHFGRIRFADDEQVEVEVRKLLRHQSEKTFMLRVSTHW